MAPKNKFTKEQIIDAAFEIARLEGMHGITIRKVADQLGSSIAPIYVNFKDVNELIREVMRKVADISKQYLAEIDSGNPFHDIGVASVRFAKEYSEIFRGLVMRPNHHTQDYDEDMGGMIIAMMKQDADLAGLSEDELQLILLKMRIFQTGLSIMVANGLFLDNDYEAKAIELLDSTASDIITAARLRRHSS